MLDEDEMIKEFLQNAAHNMYQVMTNSNFQTEVHEMYLDLGAIGMGCMFIGEHDEKIVHFNSRSMKEIFVDENNLGLIDTVVREFKWKARQIVQEFGFKNVPNIIKKADESGSNDQFTIIHSVEPKDMDDEDDKPSIFKFESCYTLKEQKYILSESGFREFPYAVPRWTKSSGEKYGRGPGMDALPDIKMVNIMMQTTLEGAQKTVNPPLMVSDDGVIGRVRLSPGGLTVVRPTTDLPIRPLITDARVDFGYQAVEDVRKRIRSAFFVDQLQLNEGPQMTATEVQQRTEEKLRLMGPVLGRQHFEFLRPVIERVFGIMARRGKFPVAPQKIQGKAFDVRYSSLVARAQRMSEGQNLVRAISAAAPIFQMDPGSMDVVDTDGSVRHIFDIYGLPSKVMRKSNAVEEIRTARQQAQQAAVQQQQNSQMAQDAGAVMPGMAQMAKVAGEQGQQ
jgi:hypothetical protein